MMLQGSQALVSLHSLHKNDEELSAKNTSLTPQQWFVLAFLEERIPLISKTVKFILGFALFSSWDVNFHALQLKKIQNAVAVLGSAPAAGSSCCLCCSPHPPAFAWEKANPFQRGGGARNGFDLPQ